MPVVVAVLEHSHCTHTEHLFSRNELVFLWLSPHQTLLFLYSRDFNWCEENISSTVFHLSEVKWLLRLMSGFPKGYSLSCSAAKITNIKVVGMGGRGMIWVALTYLLQKQQSLLKLNSLLYERKSRFPFCTTACLENITLSRVILKLFAIVQLLTSCPFQERSKLVSKLYRLT